MQEHYDEPVLAEDGFIVELSDRGSKKKENPSPFNPEREDIDCLIDGCVGKTKSVWGICSSCKKAKKKIEHERDWIGRIILPGGVREDFIGHAPTHRKLTELLIRWANEKDTGDRFRLLDGFFNDFLAKTVDKIPDATTLHKVRTGKIKDSKIPGPNQLICLVKSLIDEHFNESDYTGIYVPGPITFSYENRNGDKNKKVIERIPLRICLAIVSIAYICEASNRGDDWWFSFYKPVAGKPKRGSVFMPFVYYLLRRYTKATEEQAGICLK